MKLLPKIILSAFCALCLQPSALFAYEKSSEAPIDKSKVTLGNGEKNWIVAEGVTRYESTLTFPEVNIDGNGWLVMHPFENGKPNGDKYVAYTYLESGKNTDVPVEVYKGIETGEMFIIMLHRDVNENKVLDFVFVTDTVVMDSPVFEGTTMIAHAMPSP